MPGALDCQSQFALMTRAGANLATGANLGTVRQIAAELFGIFIVNEFVFVFAVNADTAHGGTETALLSIAPTVTTTTTTTVIASGSAAAGTTRTAA